MLHCEKCNIDITGNPNYCPLCQEDLTGIAEEEPNIFPTIPPQPHIHRRFLRMIALASFAAVAVCVAVNLSLPGRWWSLFVIAGIGSLWVGIAFVVQKRKNLPKTILWQVGLISAMAILWDLCTGFYRWSLDYVLPLLCAFAMLAMLVIVRLMRLKIEDYIIYLMLDIVLGIIPLLLIVCNALTVVVPSAICTAVSIISLSVLFLYHGKALKSEIARRMHL